MAPIRIPYNIKLGRIGISGIKQKTFYLKGAIPLCIVNIYYN